MIATVAIRTGIAPSVLLEQDDQMLRTMLEVLGDEAREAQRG